MRSAAHGRTSGRPEAGRCSRSTTCAPRFSTPRGLVRAVDGVSFTLERGQALGIVGESGSGKTILSRSIMGLLPGATSSAPARSASRAGHAPPQPKQMRHIWGQEMAMVFQDPMTSLNPLMKIGKQITEPLRLHLGMTAATPRRRPSACCATSASPNRAAVSTSTRTSCRAACASG